MKNFIFTLSTLFLFTGCGGSLTDKIENVIENFNSFADWKEEISRISKKTVLSDSIAIAGTGPKENIFPPLLEIAVTTYTVDGHLDIPFRVSDADGNIVEVNVSVKDNSLAETQVVQVLQNAIDIDSKNGVDLTLRLTALKSGSTTVTLSVFDSFEEDNKSITRRTGTAATININVSGVATLSNVVTATSPSYGVTLTAEDDLASIAFAPIVDTIGTPQQMFIKIDGQFRAGATFPSDYTGKEFIYTFNSKTYDGLFTSGILEY